jgi:hypothetical protein
MSEPVKFLHYYWALFTQDQKEEVLERLGIGRTTMYDRINNPQDMTISEASALVDYIRESIGHKWPVDAVTGTVIIKTPSYAKPTLV